MAHDGDIAKLLALLGMPEEPSDAARTAAGLRHYDLGTDRDGIRVSRTEARLLLFLEAQLRDWLGGGDPAGAESDLRWSVVRSDEADWLEIRIGGRPPMRLGRSVAAVAIAQRDQLRDFVGGRL